LLHGFAGVTVLPAGAVTDALPFNNNGVPAFTDGVVVVELVTPGPEIA
jgi:hypothetical protein